MSELGKALGDSANKIATEANKLNNRQVLATSRLHFVPFIIPYKGGKVNIVEKFFGSSVSFRVSASDSANLQTLIAEAVEKYNLSARSQIGEGKSTDPEVIQDKTKRQKVTKELEKTWNKIVQDTIDKSIASFGDILVALVAFVKAKHKNKVIIDKNGIWREYDNTTKVIPKEALKSYTPCVVYNINKNDEDIIGALYSNYTSAGSGLFTPFFNKIISEKVLKYSDTYAAAVQKQYGKDLSEKVFGIDIGHLAGVSDYVQTVLQEKIVSGINEIAEQVQSAPGNAALLNAKKALENIQETLISQSRFGSEIEELIEINVNLKAALSGGTILIVIPQIRFQNQYEYGTLIEGALAREIADITITKRASPSFIDMVGVKIYEAIKYGKSKTKFTNKSIKATSKIKVSPTSGKSSIVKEKLSKTKVSNVKVRKLQLPPPKQPSVSFTTNLVSLQNLINASLVEQVKRNMGRGNRRDVLNLRTGRFAESVKVERMSESRQGMITAFYSYMKNPYATFSQGGAQDAPKSRDPKLLISKSIREIAAQQVANRLRSVVI